MRCANWEGLEIVRILIVIYKAVKLAVCNPSKNVDVDVVARKHDR